MNQVIVDNYEFSINGDIGETRFLINNDYLMIIPATEAESFARNAVVSNDSITVPAQRMAPQKFISAPTAEDEDVILHSLNYYLSDDDLSDFYLGEVQPVEFVFPSHQYVTQFQQELSQTKV